MKKEELGEIIDKCIELSAKVERAEIVFKGVSNEIRTEIDEISTQLFFHYKPGNEK